jgi:two-component system, chemotaxis family, chemotaxis protein CheY
MEQKIKVLAVDDSRVSLLTIKRSLNDTEFELVAGLSRGSEVLERFDEIAPDLILLDVVMPDMDGVTLLERIRAHAPDARVIMVSSLGTREKISECLEKGAANFLVKPYDKQGLITALRAAHAAGR